jgi:hypothetical protein
MLAHTSECLLYDHPDFAVEWSGDDALKPWLTSFLEWLESQVAAGIRFLPDETVQFGWSIMKVVPRPEDTLALFEPDFTSMPIAFIDSVSNTVLHTMLQRFTADSVDLTTSMEIPSLLETCIVCSRFGKNEAVTLDRAKPSNERDSGWFFGCTQPDHDHNNLDELQRKSLYEAAALMDSRLIPFLALPPGVKVYLDQSDLAIWQEGKMLGFKADSYLAKKYAGSTTGPD